MENNAVITVISYCTKGLNNSKTKQKPIPTIYNKSIKSRVFNLTEGSFILRVFFLRELIFADRGQSAKFAKIRTRKIFMLNGKYTASLRERAEEILGGRGRCSLLFSLLSSPFLPEAPGTQATPTQA